MTLTLVLMMAALARAQTVDPLAVPNLAWQAKGFNARQRVIGSKAGLSAAAIIYSPTERGGDRLAIYVIAKNKAYLGFTHPSTIDRLEFDPSPAGRFIDMFHDGSLALAYNSTRHSLGTDLNILRWNLFKFERVAIFPEGRFILLKGRAIIMARDLPLGRYLVMGCEDFGTISRTAFRTTLHAPRDHGFLNVSSEYPDYYKSELERKEKIMAHLKVELEKNAGEYLGFAISTYYDYSALGRSREGWSHLREYFTVPKLAPAAVKTCMSSMEKELRRKLGVPTDWP